MAKIDDFKARFPNFDTSVVDSLFPVIQDLAICYYGGSYDESPCEKEIILNLYAHLLTLENNATSETVRNQTSKSVGNVSVSFEASTEVGTRGWFNTTRYGQQFLYLTSRNAGAIFV